MLSPSDFVCSWILSTGMDPIAMDQLREQEELGYIVRCGLQEAHGRLFFTTLTQSTKVGSAFLMERYRRLFRDTLKGLGAEPFFHQEKFEALRSACIDLLKAPEGSPAALLTKISSLAFNRSKKWDFEKEAIAVAETLTFDRFKEFCQKVLGEDFSAQLLVAVEGLLQPEP
ncbi:hypothetical protein HAT2_00610 [Candidatus Similichlamydia laticola]|uniref:Coenzyme PQQ synthesis protein F-like C-terminal lobe domain-containing protein n=2 Tax=Candidatus Similichlamydia laticola TaxID=2170265 RepID=A0A369KCE9_9BACT|nr:hypothetical protein HAT2_00610 [Candidatus Similichlamydia laticola]